MFLGLFCVCQRVDEFATISFAEKKWIERGCILLVGSHFHLRRGCPSVSWCQRRLTLVGIFTPFPLPRKVDVTYYGTQQKCSNHNQIIYPKHCFLSVLQLLFFSFRSMMSSAPMQEKLWVIDIVARHCSIKLKRHLSCDHDPRLHASSSTCMWMIIPCHRLWVHPP